MHLYEENHFAGSVLTAILKNGRYLGFSNGQLSQFLKYVLENNCAKFGAYITICTIPLENCSYLPHPSVGPSQITSGPENSIWIKAFLFA